METPDGSSYREWDPAGRDTKWFAYGRTPSQMVLADVRPLAVDYAERLWRWVF
jgi:hypothetical protein